jgi:molybdopterin-containing oxidoreductase family iron-sulfur binding subunit
MLGLMGASLALASLQGCRRPVEKIVPFAKAPEDRIPGIPKYYATTMPFGTGAYGVLVESHEGRPTKIEGNELHPASLGAASAWTQASILGLYDPDRLSSVRGPAEEEGMSAVSSWDAFEAFWQERRSGHLADGGADLAILSDAYTSPTMARLKGAFEERFPNARWVVHEPAGDESIFAGIRLATGQDLRPVYHFDRARVIVALDADPLLADTNSVAHARGFAAGRTPDSGMNRLYAVESTLSLTGAAADHRVRLRSSEMSGFVAALASELMARGVALDLPSASAETVPPELAAELAAMADDLTAAGNAGLVVAGRTLSPSIHALVQAINTSLGGPVSLHPLTDVGSADAEAAGSLVQAMSGGEIGSLIILGGNPAYDLPADLEFASAIGKVAHTVHLTDSENETSSLCEWSLPRAHYLEAWGDARNVDGAASIVQPLIAPLLGGRSDLEILSLMTEGVSSSGYELVQATWRESLLAGVDFDRKWQQVLHDGVFGDSTSPAVEAAPDSKGLARAWQAVTGAKSTSGLEVTFRPSITVFDGRFANSSWLQEIPDPITKITWNNAALVSPATATSLGVETGDVVRISSGERQLEAALFILPGQADRSVTLTLGYGRTAAGRVGSDIGYNAFAMRSSNALWVEHGATLEPTGRRQSLVQTQGHWRMEGRHLVREATLAEYQGNPRFAATPEEHLDPVELWPAHDYGEGYQWGMAIDLNSCIGCNACVVACQSENNIPVVGADQVSRGREMQWLRIDRYFAGDLDEPDVVFQPVTCQHCENAPCEQVCPVAATVHDGEGLNLMVYNRCIGTRYCSNNCPYKVRRFNFYNFTKDTPELVKLAMNPDVTVRSRGVMEKCTFCLQRINAAKISAKKEDRSVEDGDLRTACQQTCPTNAITFGNINNPESQVSQVKSDDRNYLLLAELGNKPRTSYLARIRNRTGEKKA